MFTVTEVSNKAMNHIFIESQKTDKMLNQMHSVFC